MSALPCISRTIVLKYPLVPPSAVTAALCRSKTVVAKVRPAAVAPAALDCVLATRVRRVNIPQTPAGVASATVVALAAGAAFVAHPPRACVSTTLLSPPTPAIDAFAPHVTAPAPLDCVSATVVAPVTAVPRAIAPTANACLSETVLAPVTASVPTPVEGMPLVAFS